MRFLGVDYGGSRTGLALSDPLGITCGPVGTIHEKDEDVLVGRVLEAAVENSVTMIVVGLPRPLSGGSNAQSEAAMAFKERLESKTSIPVKMWDERFTSKLADRGRERKSGAAHKGEQDAVAACYMLQSYLDSRTQLTEDS